MNVHVRTSRPRRPRRSMSARASRYAGAHRADRQVGHRRQLVLAGPGDPPRDACRVRDAVFEPCRTSVRCRVVRGRAECPTVREDLEDVQGSALALRGVGHGGQVTADSATRTRKAVDVGTASTTPADLGWPSVGPVPCHGGGGPTVLLHRILPEWPARVRSHPPRRAYRGPYHLRTDGRVAVRLAVTTERTRGAEAGVEASGRRFAAAYRGSGDVPRTNTATTMPTRNAARNTATNARNQRSMVLAPTMKPVARPPMKYAGNMPTLEPGSSIEPRACVVSKPTTTQTTTPTAEARTQRRRLGCSATSSAARSRFAGSVMPDRIRKSRRGPEAGRRLVVNFPRRMCHTDGGRRTTVGAIGQLPYRKDPARHW